MGVRITPEVVQQIRHAIDIDGGHWHSMGVSSNGTAWGWGDNHSGQLGDGTTEKRTRPVKVLAVGTAAEAR